MFKLATLTLIGASAVSASHSLKGKRKPRVGKAKSKVHGPAGTNKAGDWIKHHGHVQATESRLAKDLPAIFKKNAEYINKFSNPKAKMTPKPKKGREQRPADHLNSPEAQEIRPEPTIGQDLPSADELFRFMDTNHNGRLSTEELESGMEERGLNEPTRELILGQVDGNFLNKDEFKILYNFYKAQKENLQYE